MEWWGRMARGGEVVDSSGRKPEAEVKRWPNVSLIYLSLSLSLSLSHPQSLTAP